MVLARMVAHCDRTNAHARDGQASFSRTRLVRFKRLGSRQKIGAVSCFLALQLLDF